MSALALSRGIKSTGILTFLPYIPCKELDLRSARTCLVLLSPFVWNVSLASLLQADMTSFAASPLNPSAASHSEKIGCHLLHASTVQLPILLSSFAILRDERGNVSVTSNQRRYWAIVFHSLVPRLLQNVNMCTWEEPGIFSHMTMT